MTASLRASAQKGILNKSGPLANKKTDDNTPFSMSYGCVNHFLADASDGPQRMVLECGQSAERQCITVSLDEIPRETAIELAESKYFEAAFNLADNRKQLRNACQQAKRFYAEHCLHRNPFPPKQKFAFVLERHQKTRENATAEQKTVKTTESTLSVLDGTMSLTSMASHSQLYNTTPSYPINLKTKKKKSHHSIPDSQLHNREKKVKTSPATAPVEKRASTKRNDENRLLNTYNTSE
ncbi:unnamed protein product [Caenorhabditis sp. 36 PRJEB53466]|nr:unnamed protein product [Caenorhabditis sp. 36 PRJEB53466]